VQRCVPILLAQLAARGALAGIAHQVRLTGQGAPVAAFAASAGVACHEEQTTISRISTNTPSIIQIISVNPAVVCAILAAGFGVAGRPGAVGEVARASAVSESVNGALINREQLVHDELCACALRLLRWFLATG